ncbi:PRC-barrel domain-containing protein [Algoriphagus jejuensis]
MTSTHHSQIRCSTVFSSTVETARSESVGSIDEFMNNIHTGEIDYVVLKVDQGFLNLGSKLLALPFESFDFSRAENEGIIVVNETKETLENAPGFEENAWPSGPQPEFLHTIRSYYSEKARSLHGRYDPEKRAVRSEGDPFEVESSGRGESEFQTKRDSLS